MTTARILDATTGAQPNADGTQPGTDQRSVSEALAAGVIIIDAKGRRLKLKRPTILQEARLIRVIGEAAESQMYLNAYVMPAVMVVEIDGMECYFPATGNELEAQIQRLDREGMGAVIKYITSQPKGEVKEGEVIKN